MKAKYQKILLIVGLTLLLALFTATSLCAQTIGKTTTEQFKASFETKLDISQYMDYSGPTIPIQILKCGIGEEVYEQYPELKEKRVGLGVANISFCLLYTSPSPRDRTRSRMPSSA